MTAGRQFNEGRWSWFPASYIGRLKGNEDDIKGDENDTAPMLGYSRWEQDRLLQILSLDVVWLAYNKIHCLASRWPTARSPYEVCGAFHISAACSEMRQATRLHW